MSFIDKLLKINYLYWNKYINHKFFKEYLLSKLSIEQEKNFFYQDNMYLTNYLKIVDKLKLSVNLEVLNFSKFFAANILEEIELNKINFKSKLNCSTLNYINYLNKNISNDDLTNLVLTFACSYGYYCGVNKINTWIEKNNIFIKKSKKKWSENFLSKTNKKLVKKQIELINKLSKKINKEKENKLLNIFSICCKLEIDFFNQIYPKKEKSILTIAGSDSIGGAGIQADIKTFTVSNLYSTSVITSVTSQNTLAVDSIYNLPKKEIINQLESIFYDHEPNVIKIGMLSNSEIINCVFNFLFPLKKLIILDPVMKSETGFQLLKSNDVFELKKIINISYLITPNKFEAEILSNLKILNKNDAKKAIEKIWNSYNSKYILLKGGHINNLNKSIDYFYDGKKIIEFKSNFIKNTGLHGTGCSLSSSIAANLCKGYNIIDSIKKAKNFVYNAIKYRKNIGNGKNPINHSWRLKNE